MSEPIGQLTDRMREIFGQVVDRYIDSGAPVGSKVIAEKVNLSPASIRGVMQQLEERGLLTHPHTSAGRVPTEMGLRLFVDGIMQASLPQKRMRQRIEAEIEGRPVEEALRAATQTLSGLSECAGVVTAPTQEVRLKQLAFVQLDEGRALAVLVGDDGSVENRVVPIPPGTSSFALAEVGNYATQKLAGLTLSEASQRLRRDIAAHKDAVDHAAAELVAAGLADWSRDGDNRPVLIVRGQANLIDESAAADLERVRLLLEELEDRQEIARLLDGARDGEGVRIFIGSENRMFALSGSSVIAKPYRGVDGEVIGVIGVIGPTRLNYARVVPMVDFTAEALTRRMS
ncbi:heat-inducible transcriptional repressor HrcA [Sphingomicrobium lutaoense]|uniref:Heat-inducible transcription repressor HrcA n=1 Tax=Sphingomicrobium lutaoense TaxID=515949 RepID=A0A839Z349_9SPHN|nr:heat-inducible transcriptional repressor HrcA [Sphingomicrobium lutaoense]MBB3764005.1 heat-inducible transcriptional repressor [Sphingomicrobium lutaoense]